MASKKPSSHSLAECDQRYDDQRHHEARNNEPRPSGSGLPNVSNPTPSRSRLVESKITR